MCLAPFKLSFTRRIHITVKDNVCGKIYYSDARSTVVHGVDGCVVKLGQHRSLLVKRGRKNRSAKHTILCMITGLNLCPCEKIFWVKT